MNLGRYSMIHKKSAGRFKSHQNGSVKELWSLTGCIRSAFCFSNWLKLNFECHINIKYKYHRCIQEPLAKYSSTFKWLIIYGFLWDKLDLKYGAMIECNVGPHLKLKYLAPSLHWELSLGILKLNVKRALVMSMFIKGLPL